MIPISDQDAEVCARLNERIGELICIVGPVKAVELIRDRNKTYEYCLSLNIRSPKSRATSVSGIQEAINEIGYPCFVKFSESVGSRGVFKASNWRELSEIASRIDASSTFQLQEEVIGYFSDITGFSSDGILISHFSFKTGYEHSHGGHPPYATEVRDPELETILEKIVTGLRWTGGIDIDLLTDEQGNHYVLEINPRLSGTSVFAYKLGIDFPQHYVECFLGKSKSVATDLSTEPISQFVSVVEEAFALARGAKIDHLEKYSAYREATLDNTFPDDPGYNRALLFRKWSVYQFHRYPRVVALYRFIRKAGASVRVRFKSS